MTQSQSVRTTAVARPYMPLMMIICGVVGALAGGVASAATPNDDIPSLAVRYSAASLETDHGAQVLYTRLVHAAEQVCPAGFTGSRLVSASVQRCRDEAVARAVQLIDNPRLVAVYSGTMKRG